MESSRSRLDVSRQQRLWMQPLLKKAGQESKSHSQVLLRGRVNGSRILIDRRVSATASCSTCNDLCRICLYMKARKSIDSHILKARAREGGAFVYHIYFPDTHISYSGCVSKSRNEKRSITSWRRLGVVLLWRLLHGEGWRSSNRRQGLLRYRWHVTGIGIMRPRDYSMSS